MSCAIVTESNIKSCMENYRRLCPEESVFPKIHYMEDHLISFIRTWRAGPGLLGEQGGESIHHQFNQLKARYANMPSPADRLYHLLKVHLQSRNPDNPEAPTPAKRARSDST